MSSFLSQPGNTPQAFFSIGRGVAALGGCDKEDFIQLVSIGNAEDEVRVAVAACLESGILEDGAKGLCVSGEWESSLSERTPESFALKVAELSAKDAPGLSGLFSTVRAFLGASGGAMTQHSWTDVLKEDFAEEAEWPIQNNQEQVRNAERWLDFLGASRLIGGDRYPDCAKWMALWLTRFQSGAGWTLPLTEWWQAVRRAFPALGSQSFEKESVQLTLLILEKRGILRFMDVADAAGENFSLGLPGNVAKSRSVNTVRHLGGSPQ